MRPKVVVGMSGGVDSSIAALLLLQQGYDVSGIFMKNWEEDDDEFCQATDDLKNAQAVCDILGIKLQTVNFSKEYWQQVFQIFIDEYSAGRTPNPDILCNKEIKFKAFLDYARNLGADYIATGHYAGIARENNTIKLLQAADKNKDQSYFLYALSAEQLKYSIFPLSNIDKNEVRQIAKKNNLPNYNRKDSTGICFIGERKFYDFIKTYVPSQPGNIETADGKVVGSHNGCMYYTIGQRQGLGIGGLKQAEDKPWYVYGKDLARNVIKVTQNEKDPLLFANKLTACNVSWVTPEIIAAEFKASAKIRYRQPHQSCVVKCLDNNSISVEFDMPQRAVTPGQSVVLYDNEICLGGGIIQ